MKEAEGCFPAKFLPVEKIRKGGDERKEGKRKRLAISCIPFALPALSSIGSHLLFLSSSPIPFAFPYFPSPLLVFPFSTGSSLSPLERNKNNGERFLGPEEPQRKAADDAGRSILAQKEEREIKEERKKEKILWWRIRGEYKRGYKFVEIFKYLAIFHLFY